MKRGLLLAGGLFTVTLAGFKIAMPYLFHWQEAMGSGESFLWSTIYAENLGISLLLYFAYMSIFAWRQLLGTSLGKTILSSIATLWAWRTAAEIWLFEPGKDGAWWRVALFAALTLLYMLSLVSSSQKLRKGTKVPLA